MPSAIEPPSLIVRAGERVAGRAELLDFAAALQRRVTGRRSFTCLFTNDAELRGLNRRFRGKNKATDVLTFPATWGSQSWLQPPFQAAVGSRLKAGCRQDCPPHNSGALGDIAISLDHARAQAREFGHRVGDELRILMLHGVLHLLGMDHEADSGEMARSEVAWRKKLGLPAGLIERVQA